MKKVGTFLLSICLLFMSSCSGLFGYEKYTDIADYSEIFDLYEVRNIEAMELFPKSVENLCVEEFYFEWKLGIIGSADVQLQLSVTYDDVALGEEILRIQSLADGKTVFDMTSFNYDAYVLVLGYFNSSYYALIDGNTIHYIMLQLIPKKHIDIERTLLPKEYFGYGEVENASYSVYNEEAGL